MIVVMTVNDVQRGNIEAKDWAKRMTACRGEAMAAYTPVLGEIDRIVFLHRFDSLADFDRHLHRPNRTFDALLEENREKHLMENTERVVFEEIE